MRPDLARGFTGQIPLRMFGRPDGPLRGLGRWASVRKLEHAQLCRAFNLDPIRFYFEFPNETSRTGSPLHGLVFMAGRNDPVGKIVECRSDDRFKDVDPNSVRDFDRFWNC